MPHGSVFRRKKKKKKEVMVGQQEHLVQLRRDAVSTSWGFRLQGGQENNTPLTVQRVSLRGCQSTPLALSSLVSLRGLSERSVGYGCSSSSSAQLLLGSALLKIAAWCRITLDYDVSRSRAPRYARIPATAAAAAAAAADMQLLNVRALSNS